MDLFDDLLTSLERQVPDEVSITGAKESVCYIPSEAAKEPESPQESSDGADATICLLEDCLASLWKEQDAGKGGDAPAVNGNTSSTCSSSNSNGAEQECSSNDNARAEQVTLATSPGPKKRTATAMSSSGSSLLSKAVQNRIQREKDEARGKRVDRINDATLTTSAASSSPIPLPKEDKGATIEPVAEDLVGQMNHDANAIATKCFEAFLQEMKDFKMNSSQLKSREELMGFVDYLTEKYIRLSLDKIPATPSAIKARSVICSFIDKLEQLAGGGGSGSGRASSPTEPWACAICSKQNAPSTALCQTCGRKKGHVGKEKKPPKPCHVPIVSKAARAKKSNKTGHERRKDMFLKQKEDYEAEARQDIKDEINDLLGSVVRSTISS